MNKYKTFFLLMVGFLFTCKNISETNQSNTSFNSENLDNWKYKFDFDGDQQIDTIKYEYTGGAHCCYKLNIFLSSTKKDILVPFEIEGGYVIFDLSKPDQFAINDFDKDSLPEIFIQLFSSNKENYKHIRNKYNIKSNQILVDFNNGQKIYKDFNK